MLLSRCAHLSFNPISLNSQFEVTLPYRHTKVKQVIIDPDQRTADINRDNNSIVFKKIE